MHPFPASGLGMTSLGLITVLFLYGRARSGLRLMAAAMIAMAIAMVTGLVGGMAAVLTGMDLAPATVAAVIGGAGVGLVLGGPAGAMAALDGVLAGLMGGLMGPMTVAMLDPGGQELVLGVVGWAGVLGLGLAVCVIKGEKS